MASSFTRLLDNTQRRTTVGRTPLDGWSARRRDLYLTTHNIHNRQTFMPPVGFEPTISSRRAAADLRLRRRGQWDRHHRQIQVLIPKAEACFFSETSKFPYQPTHSRTQMTMIWIRFYIRLKNFKLCILILSNQIDFGGLIYTDPTDILCDYHTQLLHRNSTDLSVDMLGYIQLTL